MGEYSERKTRKLDKCTWREAWISYLQAIERSSDKKLRKIFGEAGCPEELPFKETAITEENLLLYGEFLRQNHGRLAFEIIKYGFPGSVDLDVFRKTEIDDEIRDIIAIAARSHTIALRQAVPYLEGHYTPAAEPKNIKIFYLMSLLRMADYLDAGYDRAPHVIELMRGIRSEVSAGASFRNSEIWEKNYIRNGESVIARSGKFGIGVLSAFLLGNYVEVTTRHLSEDLGYSFGIEIGRENINIERTEAPIGTKLMVKSSAETLDEIVSGTEYPKWTDWYCFQNPNIEYILDGQVIYHEEEYVPNIDEEFEGWYLLEGTEYASYKWSYDAKHLSGINAFCNGIPVTQGTVLNAAKYGFPLKTPIISIVDYNNKVHINLSRNQLTSFPAEKEFVREGYKYAIMRLLEEEFKSIGYSCSQALRKGFVYSERLNIEGNSSVHASQFLFAEDGYTLMSPAFLRHSKVKELLLVCVESNRIEEFAPQSASIPIWLCEIGTYRRRSFFCRAFTSIFEEEGIREKAVQFIVEKQFYDTELEGYFITQKLTEKMKLRGLNGGIYNFSLDEGMSEAALEMNWEELMEQGAIAVIRYQLDYSENLNLMGQLLEIYLKDVTWLPYKSFTDISIMNYNSGKEI